MTQENEKNNTDLQERLKKISTKEYKCVAKSEEAKNLLFQVQKIKEILEKDNHENEVINGLITKLENLHADLDKLENKFYPQQLNKDSFANVLKKAQKIYNTMESKFKEVKVALGKNESVEELEIILKEAKTSLDKIETIAQNPSEKSYTQVMAGFFVKQDPLADNYVSLVNHYRALKDKDLKLKTA